MGFYYIHFKNLVFLKTRNVKERKILRPQKIDVFAGKRNINSQADITNSNC